jgi:hypothetical protein
MALAQPTTDECSPDSRNGFRSRSARLAPAADTELIAMLVVLIAGVLLLLLGEVLASARRQTADPEQDRIQFASAAMSPSPTRELNEAA